MRCRERTNRLRDARAARVHMGRVRLFAFKPQDPAALAVEMKSIPENIAPAHARGLQAFWSVVARALRESPEGNPAEDHFIAAMNDFWAAVAAAFPEVTSGDLTPLESFCFDEAARTAFEWAVQWVTALDLLDELATVLPEPVRFSEVAADVVSAWLARNRPPR